MSKFRIGRFRKIVRFIEKNPKHWNQAWWHCGTSHCVAGFAHCAVLGLPFSSSKGDVIDARFRENVPPKHFAAYDAARDYLGLTRTQASRLFRFDRTLEELQLVAREGVKVLNRKSFIR